MLAAGRRSGRQAAKARRMSQDTESPNPESPAVETPDSPSTSEATAKRDTVRITDPLRSSKATVVEKVCDNVDSLGVCIALYFS